MGRIQRIIIISVWLLTFGIVLLAGVLMFITTKGGFGELPNIYEITNPNPKLASEIYSEDSVLLGKFYHKYDRINIDYNQISPYLINALVATEDERFYDHPGIDFQSLLRAAFFFGNSGGGSTITQQLAKNLFTLKSKDNNKRIFQKLKEWVIAVKLERNFSKREIITLYLNTVPFGDNIYGVRNAALTFFQKKSYELSMTEAALLIGMLKSNTTYNPRINPKLALERRNIVINQTFKNNYISAKERDSFVKMPIEINYLKLNEKEGIATYFREYLRKQVKSWIKRHYQKTGKRYDLYQDGLKIYTTINSKMQTYAEEGVRKHLSKMQATFNTQIRDIEAEYWQSLDSIVSIWKEKTARYKNLQKAGYDSGQISKIFNTKVLMSLFDWQRNSIDTMMSPLDSIKYYKKMLQTGALFVNPQNGHIKAWVGGINYRVFKFDHVNTAKRQVGSTIKPLLYSLAMEHYGFKPQTLCSNTPQCFTNEQDTTIWCTHNNPGSRKDSITSFAEGIIFSLNNVSAFILRHVTPSKFADFLQQKLKIQSKVYPYPSLALGTSEFSLYEMIRAYTIFPSNGVLSDLKTITRIEDAENRLIVNFPDSRRSIVLSENTAYSMAQIMQGTANYGTARRLRYVYKIKGDIGGKTGTTNDFSDAWFIGFNSKMLGGVWVGCEDKIISFQTSEGEGSSMALPIFGEFWDRCTNDKSFDFVKATFKPSFDVDENIPKTIKKLGKMGLESFLEQKKGEPVDSSLFTFVLNDPYHKKIWHQDSLLQQQQQDSTNKEDSVDIFQEFLDTQ